MIGNRKKEIFSNQGRVGVCLKNMETFRDITVHTLKRLARGLRAWPLICVCAVVTPGKLDAASVVLPEDPRESIRYWMPLVVAETEDERVALAHEIFSVLLRTWDAARVEPSLHVVTSTAGPWAASLADGNVLLSREAIETCFDIGGRNAIHLLAFVLAHELAHQRVNDLWHRKFLRLVGDALARSSPALLEQVKRDMPTGPDLEKKEWQADLDGLVMMASVGFDPAQVVGKKDFFTAWVENVLHSPCVADSTVALEPACQKAKTRAQRARLQMQATVNNLALFDLAVQNYVAAKYAKAAHYFEAYARRFPGRAVFNNIGLSYMQQALDVMSGMIESGQLSRPAFKYFMLLEASPAASSYVVQRSKRGVPRQALDKKTEKIRELLTKARAAFDKALRMEPGHRSAYLLLAQAYLLEGNSFMLRGVIQGQYIPRFGADMAAQMLLALVLVEEGKVDASLEALTALAASKAEQEDGLPIISGTQLKYHVVANAVALLRFLGRDEQAGNMLKKFVSAAKKMNDPVLFGQVVSQLHAGQSQLQNRGFDTVAVSVVGEKFELNDTSVVAAEELFLDGQKLTIYHLGRDAKYVVDEAGTIVSAVNGADSLPIAGVKVGDDVRRIFRRLGLPDRRVGLTSGEYFAFDHLGVAFHSLAGKVRGWFYYSRSRS